MRHGQWTAAVVAESPFPCRGIARAHRRRMAAASWKTTDAKSPHGRTMAARALELARGEQTATERAFRRLGFGWKPPATR